MTRVRQSLEEGLHDGPQFGAATGSTDDLEPVVALVAIWVAFIVYAWVRQRRR